MISDNYDAQNEVQSYRACKYCLEPFTPITVRHIYCSTTCRNLAIYKRVRKYYRSPKKRGARYIEASKGNWHEAHILNASQLIYNEILNLHQIPVKKELKLTFIDLFFGAWKRIKKGTKFRSPAYSCPVFIYLFCKSEGIILDKEKIKAHFNITEKEFRKGLSLLIPLYEQYAERDKKSYLIRQAEHLVKALALDPPFLMTALRIIDVFWPQLQGIKEKLAIGVVLLLSFITLGLPSSRFSDACQTSKVRKSSAYNAVNAHILNETPSIRFRGFSNPTDHIKTYIDGRLAKK